MHISSFIRIAYITYKVGALQYGYSSETKNEIERRGKGQKSERCHLGISRTLQDNECRTVVRAVVGASRAANRPHRIPDGDNQGRYERRID